MTSTCEPVPPAVTPLKVLFLVGVLITSAFVLVPELGDVLPRTADQQAVATVVERTIVANQSVGLPPERDSYGEVSPATVERMRANVRQVAAELLTPSYREGWIARMDEVVDIETSSEFIFDGGADDFRRWRIAIQGDRATVTVRCRIFLVMAQTFDGQRHRAENVVDYEMTLERVGDAWLVASETNRFAPGGRP